MQNGQTKQEIGSADKTSEQRRAVWRAKSLMDQLCNYLLNGEVEDRAVFVLDLLVGMIPECFAVRRR
jgi:hypothetical protein